MKYLRFLIVILTAYILFPATAYTQQKYLTSFEKKITPSPMVSALGSYGGLDLKKNTGGIQKSISLLDVKEGDLSYQPSIEYFSTGIKVDDWGSRVGIGWTENITAVISRVVRNLADEKATSRVGDGRLEFGDSGNPQYTQSDYDKVRALEDPYSGKDGEYDLFSFNVFGASGQFIIRNNQPVLLADNNSYKIDIIQTTPTYQFILTNQEGFKYYFNSATESANFSNDNSCDNDSPYIPENTTAWFVDKIVSPTGNTIRFNYEDAQYTYFYDFNEYYLYSEFHYMNVSSCADDPESGIHNYCLRKKTTKTKRLTSVTGDNFTVAFDYRNRNDISNEKLLNKITLSNNSRIIKEVSFTYDEIVASSNFEPIVLASLPGGDTGAELKTRYFLKSIQIGNSQIEQTYKFGYLNAGDLPHRFSLSQDYIGCYNAKGNASLVPKLSTEKMSPVALLGYPYPAVHATEGLPFANRNPALVGRAGLLNVIEYPTKGRDSIVYEQNQFRTIVVNQHKGSVYDWFSCEEWPSYSGGFFTMTVPVTGPVDLKVECYYDSEEAQTRPKEDYWADFELWDSDGNRMAFPNGQNHIQLQLNQVFYSGSSSNSYPFTGKLQLETNKDYELRVNIYGKHTTLRATLNYTESITNDVVDSIYYGYRVKKVVTKSNFSPDLIKSYNYNVFKKNGDQLVLTDSSSLSVKPFKGFGTIGYNVCSEIRDYLGRPVTTDVNLASIAYRLNSKSNYDINVFGGAPYAYRYVTEFLDDAKTSFISSEYVVSSNNYAFRMFNIGENNTPEFINSKDLELNYPNLDNMAWDHGLEIRRYYGDGVSTNYTIRKENRWEYSVLSNVFFNYGASKIVPIKSYSSNPKAMLSWYSVKSSETYSHWIKLDTLIDVNYFRQNNTYSTVVNKTLYSYNTSDKLAEAEQTTSSNGDVLLKQTFRPYKMVSLNRDPNGIYQNMINNHIISPEIEVINKKNGSQVNLLRNNYIQPFVNLFVPTSVQTQNLITDPIVTQVNYLKYDNIGNVLSLSRDGGPVVNYIWSYKGHYPIAKIENCDYIALENTVGAQNISNFRSTLPTDANIDAFLLPLRTSVPSAFITRFTFEPVVGMTSLIDPKGQLTKWEYDGFQRLKNVKDQNGYILKNYTYHYQP